MSDPTAAIWDWLEPLGGIGLILLGLADNSPVPLPGSMKVILSPHQRDWSPHYAVMATIGGCGWLHYLHTRGEGGRDDLGKKLTKAKAERVYKSFNKFGFGSLFVPALLAPGSVFAIPDCSRGLNYSRKKFLLAVGVARAIRYGAFAYLGPVTTGKFSVSSKNITSQSFGRCRLWPGLEES